MASCRATKVLLILSLCHYECSGTKEPCLIMSDYTHPHCLALLSDPLIAKTYQIVSCCSRILPRDGWEFHKGRMAPQCSLAFLITDKSWSQHLLRSLCVSDKITQSEELESDNFALQK